MFIKACKGLSLSLNKTYFFKNTFIMFIVENYPLAVLFCIITMLCWGSWGNTQKLVSKTWRFELFYWDYVFGILLFAILLAFTLGSTGSQGRGFLADLGQAESSNIGSALMGGAIFNLANILLIAAIAIAGLSVAFPVGIGIALVLGVLVNKNEGNSALLYSGVAIIAIAILLNAKAFSNLKKDNSGGTSTKGLALSVVAGVLMGFFYKYVAESMVTDFVTPEAGKLTPYTAIVFFAVGILLSNFLFNTFIMYKPFEGAPVSFADYFKGSKRDHLMGIIGGIIWCIGMSFNIIASGKTSPAIAYGLGQGATVVAAIWGIFIWKEFAGANKATKNLINIMLGLYIIGLTLIIFTKL
jgi:glucose uptake protein